MAGREVPLGDLEAGDLVVELDVVAVGGGDEDLTLVRVEVVEEEAVTRAIQFAADVIQQEDRGVAVALLHEADLRDLHREDDGAHLPLAGVGAGVVLAEFKAEVVAVGADGGEAAAAVVALAALQGAEELGLEVADVGSLSRGARSRSGTQGDVGR